MGLNKRSGSLAMPAAIFLASSFGHEIGRSASARLRLEVDIRHRKTVGVADDVRDAAIFLDCPRWWEAALGAFVLYRHPAAKEGQAYPLSTGQNSSAMA